MWTPDENKQLKRDLANRDRKIGELTAQIKKMKELQLTKQEYDAFDLFFHYLHKYGYMVAWLDNEDGDHEYVDVLHEWWKKQKVKDDDHE